MLLTQLLVGAFFFASLFTRNIHISSALVALFTWNNYAPSPAFYGVIRTIEVTPPPPARPQLYELLYGLPSTVCPETRFTLTVAKPGKIPLLLPEAPASSYTTTIATLPSLPHIFTFILALVVVSCGVASILTLKSAPHSAEGSTSVSLILSPELEPWSPNHIIFQDSENNTSLLQPPGVFLSDSGDYNPSDEGFCEHPLPHDSTLPPASIVDPLSPFNVITDEPTSITNSDVSSDEGFASIESSSDSSHEECPNESAEALALLPADSVTHLHKSESSNPPSGAESDPETFDPDAFDVEAHVYLRRYGFVLNMVGLFPGVDETGLYYSNITRRDYQAVDHVCTDGPDLNPYDVRSCKHWYRCEKPRPEDGSEPSTHIVIDNLNFSNVVDDTRPDSVVACRRITAFYDSFRLKTEVQQFGAIQMTYLVPACPQDYPYAVVHFPSIENAKAAFSRLQGRCLGDSGRHLRTQFIPPHDHTYGGRNLDGTTAEITPQITPSSPKSPHPVAKKRVQPPQPTPRGTPTLDELPKPSLPRFRRAKNGMKVRLTQDSVPITPEQEKSLLHRLSDEPYTNYRPLFG